MFVCDFIIQNKKKFGCLLMISIGLFLYSNMLITEYVNSRPYNVSNYIIECSPFNENVSQYVIQMGNGTYPRTVPLFRNSSINFECLKQNKEVKVILFWTQPNWYKDSRLGRITPFKNCPVTNCELTNNKSRINESTYVLTHMRDSIEKMPDYRPAGQRWIFMLYESPVHTGNIMKYNGYYNLTSTYKVDSDFPVCAFLNNLFLLIINLYYFYI